ncbi:MAG: hypothetical protein EBX53_06945 [Betaproteobacteria bacterium]|nr:hypothetical protein [Betaproteobacteria bacterium]
MLPTVLGRLALRCVIMHALVELRSEGLYCPLGDFYIDPWRPVQRAVITSDKSARQRLTL